MCLDLYGPMGSLYHVKTLVSRKMAQVQTRMAVDERIRRVTESAQEVLIEPLTSQGPASRGEG